jgi:Spy/CpxP family protein refolding chaperone
LGSRQTVAMLAIILGATAISQAQPNSQGAVELSSGAKVPQNPSLPKLNLTNTQREQIRETVLTE